MEGHIVCLISHVGGVQVNIDLTCKQIKDYSILPRDIEPEGLLECNVCKGGIDGKIWYVCTVCTDDCDICTDSWEDSKHWRHKMIHKFTDYDDTAVFCDSCGLGVMPHSYFGDRANDCRQFKVPQ